MRNCTAWMLGAIAGLGFLGMAQDARAQGHVRCESRDDRTQYCDIGRHSGVEISRRLSDASCNRGDDWWVEGNRIVVTDGCRAEFIVHGGGGGYGHDNYDRYDNDDRYDQRDDYDDYEDNDDYDDNYDRHDQYGYGSNRVVCESRDNQPRSCQIGRHTDVRIVRQFSDKRCSKGRDWWVRGPELVVLNGCRAEFAISR